MYGWLLHPLVRRMLGRLRQGDPGLVVALVDDAVRFRFPGRTPWSADHRSKAAFTQWLQRCAHFAPGIDVQDVIASGPPWNLRVCLCLTGYVGSLEDGGGAYPYVNEAICYVRVRWGRITEVYVCADTQTVADFFGTGSAEEFFAS